MAARHKSASPLRGILLLMMAVASPGGVLGQAAPRIETELCETRPETSGLDQRVRQVAASFGGKVQLFAKNLETGVTYGLGEDERVRTASTIKVPIMVEAFARVAEGTADWDDEFVLTRAKKVGGSGVLSEFHDGLRLTLRDAVNLMIVVSDNSATNLILDRFTTDAVNARMDALGFNETRLLRKAFGGGESQAAADPKYRRFGFGVTTPRQMATLLEQIERGEVVSAEAAREMMALLKRQQDRRGIARSLKNVKVASKAGALDRLRSDAGIVYTSRGRIVMSITCDEMPESLWIDDNPGYLMIGRVASLLVDGLSK